MKCSGKRRYGGAFSLGLPKWENCKNKPFIAVIIDQNSRPLLCCKECLKELTENNIKIFKTLLLEKAQSAKDQGFFDCKECGGSCFVYHTPYPGTEAVRVECPTCNGTGLTPLKEVNK